jgi:hypothetical protein
VCLVYIDLKKKPACIASTMREAQIQIEELHPFACRAPIHLKRKDILAGICPIAEQEMPAPGSAPNSNRELSERRHRVLTNCAFHKLKAPFSAMSCLMPELTCAERAADKIMAKDKHEREAY